MFDESEIAYHCPPRTLQRGLAIAANGRNILTKQCRYSEYATELSAFVASSNGWKDRYRTTVTLDEERGFIEEYSCTCPASFKYDGMCKHTVALTMSFCHEPHTFMGYTEQRTPETSPSIKDFMQRSMRAAREDERGSVRIEVTLCYGFEEWSAHFRVAGPKGSYVMKSIGEFVGHLRSGDHVTYGKKLAFAHTLDAFDEASAAIARFLDRAVASREQGSSHLRLSSYYYDLAPSAFRPSTTVGRRLNLTEAEAVELIDLAARAVGPAGLIAFEGEDPSVPVRCALRVIEGDPPLEIKMTEADKEGYLILRDQQIAFAADGLRMYALHGSQLFRCTSAFAQGADFLRSVYRSNDERLYVAAADMPQFCATVLPRLERQMRVSVPDSVSAYRPVECSLAFFLDRSEQAVELLAKARYGSSEVILAMPPSHIPAPDEGSEPAGLRDERAEERALALIREHFYEDARIALSDEEAVCRLLFGGLAAFQALGEVFTTPAFDRLLSTAKPRTSMGLSIVGNLINLDISAEDVTMAEVAAMLASYRKRKRFHRLRSGAYLDLQDYDLKQLDRLADDLGISPKELASGHIELPTYRAFYLDRELGDARRDGSFTRYVNQFREVDERAFTLPKGLGTTLRPYQEEGFRWLSALTEMGFGGILADEMGLGKSVQLISLLLARHEQAQGQDAPSLIVCPASLVYNWLAEFERFAPQLCVRAIVGPKRERALIRAQQDVDVFVSSYDLVRIDAKDFEARNYLFCVLDEAQYIKNHATLTTRAVKRVPSAHRFALTGTPMENRLSELWSIFDFLMPGLLGGYARFRERFEIGVVGGDEEATRRLQALVGPFVLRRMKSEVLPDLPEKMESAVFVPLAGEQRRLYAAHEQRLRVELGEQKKRSAKRGYATHTDDISKVEVLAELTKLRQICCDPALLYENYRGAAAKTEAIMELISQAMESGQKTLVFSQFTSYLERIAAELSRANVSFYRITGATPAGKRLESVNAFNADDVPVFLVSLKAGGTGLNLIGASVVIHADPWWNAAAQNQATDRAHRIGQNRAVSVYRVIAKNSIEERILLLQDAKVELADQIIGSSGSISLAQLTRQDLIELLGD